MFTITYRRIYYADVTEQAPPDGLKAEAEAAASMLLPGRIHTFHTGDSGHGLQREQRGNPAWRVTFEPVAD